MARILIAGCGDVGSALGSTLAAAGHQVWGLRRRPASLPPAITPVAGDLCDPSTLKQLPTGINVLYYTVAASEFSDEAYRAAYIEGLGTLLAVLERDQLERLLFVSSTGVYAQTDGAWVDESSATEPTGFSGRRLLEGEALAAGSKVTSVAVRFAGIYGPGRRQLLDRVRSGTGCCETPPQWTNRIHRDDCAGVLAHLLTLRSPAPVYIGVDDEPAPLCEVMDWIAAQLQLPAPARTTPQLRARGSNKRCSNRLLRTSGYQFKYANYRQGYSKILQEY